MNAPSAAAVEYRIVTCLDLTSLAGNETAADIEKLCARAILPAPGLPSVAAVCLNLAFVARAKRLLNGAGVLVATVAGGFPGGTTPLREKLAEIDAALAAGADEIDYTIDRRPFLAGDERTLFDEVAAARAGCGDAPLKVILETAELGGAERVQRAGVIALSAGATMLKTSTGKGIGGATPGAARALCAAVSEHLAASGVRAGVKFSGGIRTFAAAREYFAIVEEMLGEAALTPAYLRFGASGLFA